METTAILLLHCPDQQGIISEVTKFITDNKGNIVMTPKGSFARLLATKGFESIV